MLPGFLTTALEIIIILDICGAVVYFALTGLARMKKDGDGGETVSFSDPLRPCPVAGPAIPISTVPYSVNMPAIPIYAGPSHGPEPEKGIGLMAGFKRKIVSLKGKFAYVPSTSQKVDSGDVGSERKRLSQILESFREEL